MQAVELGNLLAQTQAVDEGRHVIELLDEAGAGGAEGGYCVVFCVDLLDVLGSEGMVGALVFFRGFWDEDG